MKLTFMDPGQLRTEMMLQDAVETPDGSGGFAVSWVDVATVWVAIEAISLRAESFGGRQIEEVSHRIVMRHRDDVKPGQRLARSSANYRVQQVADLDGTGRYLTAFALEERP
ncbi:MAG: phage head closure protein [Rhizobiaceae bacterium]